jgi:hypothetical protein
MFVFHKILPIENNPPIGDNSPNLSSLSPMNVVLICMYIEAMASQCVSQAELYNIGPPLEQHGAQLHLQEGRQVRRDDQEPPEVPEVPLGPLQDRRNDALRHPHGGSGTCTAQFKHPLTVDGSSSLLTSIYYMMAVIDCWRTSRPPLAVTDV